MTKLKLEDYIGKKYGRLTIVGSGDGDSCKKKSTYFLCKCDCGNNKVVLSDRLKNGTTKSCGCISMELSKNRFKTHGLKFHPIYSVWENIKRRCYYILSNRYYCYGARGIKVCDEWKNDFKCFYDWAISNGWKKGLQIDRQNNDGNYEPANCRWVTNKVNSNTKGYCRMYIVNNEKHNLTELAKMYGIGKAALFYRVNHGWDILTALNTPIWGKSGKPKQEQAIA